MTKRLLMVLTVLVCVLLACAQAESLPVYRLLNMDNEAAPELLGCGVLFRDQHTLLTALPVLPESSEVIAYGADGAFRVLNASVFGNMFQLMTLAQDVEQEPMPLADLYDPLCLGISSANVPVSFEPQQVQRTILGESRFDALLMSLDDDLLPGAFLSDGWSVGGIVVARHGEGDARYTVLTAEGMRPLLELIDAPSGQKWISNDVAITQDGCLLSIDWSQTDLSFAEEGDKVWITLSGLSSCYIQSACVDVAEEAILLIIAPGCSYDVWVCVGAEQPDFAARDAQPATFRTHAGERYTDHAYLDTDIYLGVSAKDQPVDPEHMADPMPAMTLEALNAAEHVWLQVVSTYEVEQDIDLTGCFVLITPEGYVFTEGSAFILSPEVGQSDVWAVPLDDLLDIYARYGDGPAAGHYVLTYFFGDQPVTAYEFVLDTNLNSK